MNRTLDNAAARDGATLPALSMGGYCPLDGDRVCSDRCKAHNDGRCFLMERMASADNALRGILAKLETR